MEPKKNPLEKERESRYTQEQQITLVSVDVRVKIRTVFRPCPASLCLFHLMSEET